MELISFEIKNFRSISQTKCLVDPRITILAGKNESGKTNILEALEKINKENKLEEKDKPQWDTNLIPEITFKFSLGNNDLNSLYENLKIIQAKSTERAAFPNDFSKEKNVEVKNELSREIIIEIGFDKDLELKGVLIDSFKEEIIKTVRKQLKQYDKLIKKIADINQNKDITDIFNLFEDTIDKDIVLELKQKIQHLKQKIPIIEQKTSEEDISNSASEMIDNSLKLINEFEKIEQKLVDRLPRFILYDSFEDSLPDKVPVNKIITEQRLNSSNLRIVWDLLKLAKLDIDSFKTNNDQKRTIASRSASKICSDSFGKFWKQNPIEISLEDKKDNLCIWVYDKGKDIPFKPTQRSKGLQWYISFFLRLKSEGIENSIILIDEPGANLHAKAQSDVLRLLEEISNENQIIFATHSPYLIPKKLQRVRLVERDIDSAETIIINSFNKGSDHETLTPIITAVGLDLSRNLLFSKENNILLEGVSDYYYLITVLNYLKEKEEYKFSKDISFMPSIGHNQITYLISIMIGWGLEYLILLDKKGTSKTYKKLLNEGIDQSKIIFVGKDEDDSIEDLFGEDDVKKYGFNNFKKKKKWKQKRYSKAAIAKDFAIKAEDEEFELSDETISNFKELFDKIKKVC
ncbi:MAG: AAA family ATPase [Candidatus Heimdallarchaeota archaeon]|nr:AAA family ATPase [Candidatus Heimdallarchaeota archaeon]